MGRNAEARILIFQGHLQEGLAVLDETAVAALCGELDPVSTALLYCSTVCAFQGLAEFDRAEEWTIAMDRWCRRHATGGFHGLCRVHRAEILRLRGDWDDAEVEAREASEELRRYSRTDVGWASAELGQIRLRLGNLAGAEEAFLEAHEQGWDPNPGLALLRLAQGDVAAAAGSIRDSLENQPQIASLEAPPNTDLRRAPLLAAEVQIAVAAGDLGTAREAAEDLDRIATSFGTKALKASAATSMGFLLLAEGEAVEAARRFQEGMHLWTEVGAPYECAQARMGLAMPSVRTGTSGRRSSSSTRPTRRLSGLAQQTDSAPRGGGRRGRQAVRRAADGEGVHVHRHRPVHEPGGVHRRRGLGASGPVAQRPARIGGCPPRR